MLRIESTINGIRLCEFYFRSAVVDSNGVEGTSSDPDSLRVRQDGQCLAIIDKDDVPQIHYKTEFIGYEGEHGGVYTDTSTITYNVLFKYGTDYLLESSLGTVAPTEAVITDPTLVTEYYIIALAYSNDGDEELFLFYNNLNGEDYTN